MDSVHYFPRKAFKDAEDYDRRQPNYTNEAAAYVAKRLFKGKSSEIVYNVLELGCGTGKFTTTLYPFLLKDVKYLATDPLEEPLLALKIKLPAVDIKMCAASDIPLPDASVENIVCAESFHWFANEGSLAEMNRVLVPGGRILLIFYYSPYGYEFPMKLNELLEGLHSSHPTVLQLHKRTWKPSIASYKHMKHVEHCFLKGIRIEDPRPYALDILMSVGVTWFMSEEEQDTAVSTLQTLFEQTDSNMPFEVDTEFYCVEKLAQ